MPNEPQPDHDDTLDAEELAEGVQDFFGADVNEDDPILQPDAPPPE